jgi:hypothetical protein
MARYLAHVVLSAWLVSQASSHFSKKDFKNLKERNKQTKKQKRKKQRNKEERKNERKTTCTRPTLKKMAFSEKS